MNILRSLYICCELITQILYQFCNYLIDKYHFFLHIRQNKPYVNEGLQTAEVDGLNVQSCDNHLRFQDFASQRRKWINNKLDNCILFEQDIFYDGIWLYVGRLSIEKRIELLMKRIPDNLLLVIVGDNDKNDKNDDYIKSLISKSNATHNVLVQREIVDSKILNLYYRSCHLFVSASSFETSCNCVVDALVAGAHVAIQPDCEHVIHKTNVVYINFDDINATNKLTQAFNSRYEAGQNNFFSSSKSG